MGKDHDTHSVKTHQFYEEAKHGTQLEDKCKISHTPTFELSAQHLIDGSTTQEEQTASC